ncbi:MAG: Gfo/Idh/MocA family oxidoreductase [Clostridiaceae bacterium]|nr:Gfo/Idh/MocA family oxidoreductase [Clostridiaceae bacterium]
MRKLRVAIIGQGRSGRNIHAEYFRLPQETVDVVAVVDPLTVRTERSREDFGCDVYGDYRELFSRDDIDLIVNATYSYMHIPVTMEFLERGFNVVTEKPAAIKADDFEKAMALAKKKGVKLAVFQNSRFAAYYQKVKSIVDSGVLGRIVEVNISFSGFARRWDWQTLQSFGGGNLYNTGPHPVDQALRFIDVPTDEMPTVFCKMDRANTFGDAEDYVKIILTAPDRPLVEVNVSSCDAYSDYTYKIQGTRGGLKGTLNQINWRYFALDEAKPQKLSRESLASPDGLPAYCSETLPWQEESWTGDAASPFTVAVGRFYRNVQAHLLEDAPLAVPNEQVLQQIRVIEECHRQNPLSRLDD